jgi:hypothetical protein
MVSIDCKRNKTKRLTKKQFKKSLSRVSKLLLHKKDKKPKKKRSKRKKASKQRASRRTSRRDLRGGAQERQHLEEDLAQSNLEIEGVNAPPVLRAHAPATTLAAAHAAARLYLDELQRKIETLEALEAERAAERSAADLDRGLEAERAAELSAADLDRGLDAAALSANKQNESLANETNKNLAEIFRTPEEKMASQESTSRPS